MTRVVPGAAPAGNLPAAKDARGEAIHRPAAGIAHPTSGERMSRRGHYGFERRRKDDLRKQKQEAKKQRKTDRSESGDTGPEMGEMQETGARPDVWEWFSPSRTRTVTSAPGTRPPNDAPDDWVLLTDVAEDSGGDEKP